MLNINNRRYSSTKKYRNALFLLLVFSLTITNHLFAQAALTPAQAAAVSTTNQGPGNATNVSARINGTNVTFYTNNFNATRRGRVTSFTPTTGTSNAINNEITRLSNLPGTSGGVIYLRRGGSNIYNFNNTIRLRSNIRIAIDPQVTLRLANNRVVLFSIGREGNNLTRLRNVEIVCASNNTNDRFTIDFRPRPGIASDPINRDNIRSNNKPNINPATAFRVGFVKNFAISGFQINGNYTTNPSVFIVADDDRSSLNTFDRIATNGVVRNASANRIATGYALVQLFSGNNIFLQNLNGTEGITVRLEPGNGRGVAGDPINARGVPQTDGAITNIRLDNITNRNGYTSLFMQPHSKLCENIDANRINAINSFCSVFITSPVLQIFPNRRRGRFSNVNIRTVTIRGNNPTIPVTGNLQARTNAVRNGSFFNAQMNLESTVFLLPAHREAVRNVFRDSRSSMPRPGFPTLFPVDGSRVRFASQTSAGVIIASSLTRSNVGPANLGRYGVNINANNVTGSFANANNGRRVLYRSDAISPIANSANTPLDCFIDGEEDQPGTPCGQIGFGN
ncbi:hypothetical protein A8C32_13445 [Flavivirga aquatica]|uniref:Uncharacterized protein n=1 Tax=Flavivirga aquatica TaxID=1849968 RepID=A0A1E5TEB4_9FLAO|nr:hypothetical protein [Flavivirga aquatica]OEK09700.1 hypothetical protein A8C32_13445 [Flavivirga aquatica]